MITFLELYWPVVVPTVLALLGIYLLLPRARNYPPLWGGLAAGLALLLVGTWLIRTEGIWVESLLFYSFAGIAILAGGMMITQNRPVHAALSFALVVLSTCGLFLLQAAPFLMAATIIVYAGAIVVTFLFVIMLAQQAGYSSADHRSREPFLASVAGTVLLGALLCLLQRAHTSSVEGEVVDFLKERLKIVLAAAQAKTWDKVLAALGDDEKLFKELKAAGRARTDAELKGILKGEEKMLTEPQPLPRDTKLTASTREAFQSAVDRAEVRLVELRAEKKTEAALQELREHFERVHHTGVRLQLALHGTLFPSQDLKLPDYSGTPPNRVPPPVDATGRPHMPAENVAALGRSLFTTYFLAVELAGTLLLVATIGAIAIAARRKEELK